MLERMTLRPGLHETLITREVAEALSRLDERLQQTEGLSDEVAAELLTMVHPVPFACALAIGTLVGLAAPPVPPRRPQPYPPRHSGATRS